jgi:hypothetical protein
MPPCHGGDRRFESGRARHEKRVTSCGSFFVLTGFELAISEQRERYRRFGYQTRTQKFTSSMGADVRYPVWFTRMIYYCRTNSSRALG